MSDVKRRIEQWRAGLTDSEVISRADIQELESHLREEISRLETSGLSSDEAFLVARHRLGDPAALEREFAKACPHRAILRGLCWAIMGVLLYVAASDFAYMAFYLFLTLAHLAGLPQTGLGILSGIIQIVSLTGPVLLAFWLYLHHSRRHTAGPVQASRLRAILTAAILVMGVSGLRVGSSLLASLFFQTMRPQDYVEALTVGNLVAGVFRLIVPPVLAGLFVVFYLRTRREVQAI